MWWTTIAWATARPAPADLVTDVVATVCPAGAEPALAHSFVLAEPGKPWDGALYAVALGHDALCVAHRPAGGAPVAHVRPYRLCVNCTLSEVVAVGFTDIDRDGRPDLGVAIDAITGWDPQEISGARYTSGVVFGAWTLTPDGGLVWVEGADEVSGRSLAELWRALRRK